MLTGVKSVKRRISIGFNRVSAHLAEVAGRSSAAASGRSVRRALIFGLPQQQQQRQQEQRDPAEIEKECQRAQAKLIELYASCVVSKERGEMGNT